MNKRMLAFLAIAGLTLGGFATPVLAQLRKSGLSARITASPSTIRMQVFQPGWREVPEIPSYCRSV